MGQSVTVPHYSSPVSPSCESGDYSTCTLRSALRTPDNLSQLDGSRARPIEHRSLVRLAIKCVLSWTKLKVSTAILKAKLPWDIDIHLRVQDVMVWRHQLF